MDISKFNKIVIKIGGSIFNNFEDLDNVLNQINQILNDRHVSQVVLLIGGGKLADYIREIDLTSKIGDDLAHWMAILAMDLNGKELNSSNHITIFQKHNYHFTDSFDELNILFSNKIVSNSLVVLFAPFNFLFKDDFLPHSWNVTSDSIAYYLGAKLSVDSVLLIKNVDGIFIKGMEEPLRITTPKEYRTLKQKNKLKEFGFKEHSSQKIVPIDDYLLDLIYIYKIPCVILNGSKGVNKILDFYNYPKDTQNRTFTLIKSD